MCDQWSDIIVWWNISTPLEAQRCDKGGSKAARKQYQRGFIHMYKHMVYVSLLRVSDHSLKIWNEGLQSLLKHALKQMFSSLSLEFLYLMTWRKQQIISNNYWAHRYILSKLGRFAFLNYSTKSSRFRTFKSFSNNLHLCINLHRSSFYPYK